MPSTFSPLTRRTASLIRSLVHDKSARDGESSFVLEGARLVEETLTLSSASIRFLVATPRWAEEHHQAIREIPLMICSRTTLERLTETSTLQSVLAVAAQPSWNQADILAKPGHLLVYAEELQDPTNVGTLLRSCAAFGVDGVWLSPGSADPYSPKVVRATAGTVLRIPLFPRTILEELPQHRSVLFAADPDRTRGVPLSAITTRPTRLTLAFGNEGRGLTDALCGQAATRYFIPTREDVQSLNVATSAGIALFYFSTLGPRESQ